MPHSRSPVKHSGDVHPPEVESDLDLDATPEESFAAPAMPSTPAMPAMPATFAAPAAIEPPARVARARRVARIVSPQPQPRAGGNMRATFDAARHQVRARPWAAVVAALALGLVLSRLFR